MSRALVKRTDGSFASRWTDPGSFTTTLLLLFMDHFVLSHDKGDDNPLEWDPRTIEMEIEEDFGIDLPQENFEKLMVGIHLLTTNRFYVSLPDFISYCVVLSGHPLPPNTLILPDSTDLAWGLTEGMMIFPPESQEGSPFSEEILGFLAYTLDDEGILTAPDILKIATREPNLLAKVQYDYSDDPTMFNAIWDMEYSKTKDIERIVAGRIRGLYKQISEIPFNKIDVNQVKKLARSVLAKIKSEEELTL